MDIVTLLKLGVAVGLLIGAGLLHLGYRGVRYLYRWMTAEEWPQRRADRIPLGERVRSGTTAAARAIRSGSIVVGRGIRSGSIVVGRGIRSGSVAAFHGFLSGSIWLAEATITAADALRRYVIEPLVAIGYASSASAARWLSKSWDRRVLPSLDSFNDSVSERWSGDIPSDLGPGLWNAQPRRSNRRPPTRHLAGRA